MQENFILRDSMICDYLDRLLGAHGLQIVLLNACPAARNAAFASAEAIGYAAARAVQGSPTVPVALIAIA
jgi:hypothetical protein